jgi:hypothetical protein
MSRYTKANHSVYMRFELRRRPLEHAIAAGQGGCYLRLTPDQYERLRRV